jgi:hypothetical protein
MYGDLSMMSPRIIFQYNEKHPTSLRGIHGHDCKGSGQHDGD